jgi:hypothetical protein
MYIETIYPDLWILLYHALYIAKWYEVAVDLMEHWTEYLFIKKNYLPSSGIP